MLGSSVLENFDDPRDRERWLYRGLIHGEFEAVDRTKAIRKQRLELLCKLDQDGRILPTTAVCSICDYPAIS